MIWEGMGFFKRGWYGPPGAEQSAVLCPSTFFQRPRSFSTDSVVIQGLCGRHGPRPVSIHQHHDRLVQAAACLSPPKSLPGHFRGFSGLYVAEVVMEVREWWELRVLGDLLLGPHPPSPCWQKGAYGFFVATAEHLCRVLLARAYALPQHICVRVVLP